MHTYPLLQSQMGVYLEWSKDPSKTICNIPVVATFGKEIEPDRLEKALQEIFNVRNELHTQIIIDKNGEPRQWCNKEMTIPIERKRMSEEHVRSYISKGFIRPFDLLGNEPLVHTEIIETDEHIYWLWDPHHIIIDGTTHEPHFFQIDIAAAYNGENLVPYEYGLYNFAEKEQEDFKTDAYIRAKEYYEEKFRDCVNISLSTRTQDLWGNCIRCSSFINQELIDNKCRELGISVNLLLMGAFSIVLSRLSREKKVTFYTINHGRTDKRIKHAYGMFVKSVPMLAEVDSGENALDFIKGLRAELTSSIRYGVYPFTHFCKDIRLVPKISFGFQGESMQEVTVLGGKSYPIVQPSNGSTDKDITCVIYIINGDYDIRIEASDALYEKYYLQQFANSVRNVVMQILSNPNSLINELSLISKEEQSNIISSSKGRVINYDNSETFVSRFLTKASVCGEEIAVVCGKGNYTYNDLNNVSDCIARKLIKEGIHPGDNVVISLDRCKEFIASVIGVMKAGAAYVPIDVDYPEERKQFMLTDSCTKVVITKEWLNTVKEPDKLCNNELDHINLTTPELPAYIIYTSGTTGKPKGVVVLQKNIIACATWIISEFNLKQGKRNLLQPNLSFDASTFDLFYPLMAGGTIHIVNAVLSKDVDGIAKYVEDNHITGMTLSTAFGLELLTKYNPKMDYIMLGGEKFVQVRDTYNARIYNGYGPTEFTVCSSFHIVKDSDSTTIPIGIPVPNSYSLICDQAGKLLPIGAVGELCLSGEQMSQGYHNREVITNEKFIQSDFTPFGRLYKTGDLARYNERGELEYVGRNDYQVKINGYRIELEDIERTIMTCYGVSNCVVIEDKIQNSNGLICLYLTDKEIDVMALEMEVKDKLPSYMVPDVFVPVKNFFYTSNGKIDRKHLPSFKLPSTEVLKPNTDNEKILANIIAELSDIEVNLISINTKIKFYGISSLKQNNIINILNTQHNLTIRFADCSKEETIEHIATKLTPMRKSVTANRVRLTLNQEAIYSESQKNLGTTMYNVPLVLKIHGVKMQRVKTAVENCIGSHESVLAHLAFIGDEKFMELTNSPVNVETKKLSFLPSKDYFQSLVKPFDLDKDVLSRFSLFEYNDDTFLFIDIHHIITDGYSEQIILRDILRECSGDVSSKESFTVFDYAIQEQKYLVSDEFISDRTFFNTYLDDTTSAVYPKDLNIEKPHKEGVFSKHFSNKEIKAYCSKTFVSENDLFLTLFSQYLLRYTNNNRLAINTVFHGRTEGIYSTTVGMFVKTLPFVAQYETKFKDAIAKTQKDISKIWNHSLYPLQNIYSENGIMPEVLFSFDAELNSNIKNVAIEHNIEQLNLETPKTAFSISISQKESNYEILIEYDEAFYEIRSINDFAENFINYIAETIKNGDFPKCGLLSKDKIDSVIELSYGGYVEPVQKTIVQKIKSITQSCGFRRAVIDKNGYYTYDQLNTLSNNLANRLIDNGVCFGSYVAIILGHRKDFVVSLIGVLKAGGAYVPLDSNYPYSRIKYCLEKCSINTIITSKTLYSSKLSDCLTDKYNLIFVEDLSLTACDNIDYSELSNDAYVIFTSGSTGNPKGVQVSNRALATFTNNIVNLYNLKNSDKILCHSSYGFDASVEDIFPILTVGGELHCVKTEDRIDTEAVANYIIKQGITGGGYSTQFGQSILEQFPTLPLRYLTLGGEKMLNAPLCDYDVYNTYGPTEFTVDATYYKLKKNRQHKNIPIGRPMSGAYALVLDQDGNLLPQGGIGSLYLYGDQIATGYINDLKQTQERFSVCKFLNGVSYNTGDLVRWNSEGLLEYMGRNDQQVKIRGFRIEIGEIETTIKSFPHIIETIVFVRNLHDIQKLCCFYTTDNNINKSDLRDYILDKLPEYMIPSLFVEVDGKELKHTESGKIDRKYYTTIIDIPEDDRVSNYSPPTSELEEKLCIVFEEVFNCSRVGINDHYKMDMGGNSLTPSKISIRCKKYGLNVSVSDVVQFGTPKRLSDFIKNDSQRTTNKLRHFNFDKIELVLKSQEKKIFNRIHQHTHFLVTGATGFLGIHVMYELLCQGYNVTCVVRKKEKLTTYFKHYFKKDIFDYNGQYSIIEKDLNEIQMYDIDERVTCIINCAANVKHYVDEIERKQQYAINVDAVGKLIDICINKEIELVQISTISISGESLDGASHILTENDFYINQVSDNDYVTSKFNAEGIILEAVAKNNLQAKIFRLGNLSARHSDGVFQINENTNAFLNYLRSMVKFGIISHEQNKLSFEFSPVDLVSKALIKVLLSNNSAIIYHLYNNKEGKMQTVIKSLGNSINKQLSVVDDIVYTKRRKQLEDESNLEALLGLVHYETSNTETISNTSTNSKTTNVLLKLGFEWSEPDEKYIERFLKTLQNPI